MKVGDWHFYVLLCSDGSYYAGVTTDIGRRLHEHNSTKRGAKYTKARRPVELIISERFQTRSLAQKAERHFKTLTRKQKEAIVNASR
jgi:putative endonuclease